MDEETVTVTDPVIVRAITAHKKEIEKLRQQLAECQADLAAQKAEWSKAYDIGVLAKHKFSMLEKFVQRIVALPAHGEYVSLIDEAKAAMQGDKP